MSVLIRGMEMPKTCIECEWHEHYGGDYSWCHACRMTGTMPIKNAESGRADDCPLVELLEKHGDLIDRNALKRDYRMGNDCERCETDWKSCQYDRVYSKMDFCGWLDDATVVVEAEGEE